MAAQERPLQEHYHDDGSIYYFGYGALVNSVSRQRRGITTCQAQAASLPDYRLTFACGGAANICQAQGWEVHGILMRCASPKDFDILKEFDAGYDCIQVNAVPYNDYWDEGNSGIDSGRCDDKEEGDTKASYLNALRGKRPIRANVFVMHKDVGQNGVLPTDKLPQERYLRVIASGMKNYGVHHSYIQDQIMDVPYIPNRKPSEYLSFPKAADIVPKMTLIEWNHECHRLLGQASKDKVNLLILRLGPTVIRIDDNHDPHNPFCVWVRDRLLGAQDSTWVIVQTLFDPDLPRINSREEVTAIHQAWAENQMMEKFEQAGIHATTVIQVLLEGDTRSDELDDCHTSTAGMLDNTSTSSVTSALHVDESEVQVGVDDNSEAIQEIKQKQNCTARFTKSIRSSLLSSLKGMFFRKPPSLVSRSGTTPVDGSSSVDL